MKVLFLFFAIFLLSSTYYLYLNTYFSLVKSSYTKQNFTGTVMNYCEIKDFSGNTYTGGCFDTIFIPSKVYSGNTIYLTGQRINNGIINNWKYGILGDVCYSGDNIQGDLIDCGIN